MSAPTSSSSKFPDAAPFRAASGVVHETIDGELVLMDLSNDAVFSTGDVGAVIWSAMQPTATILSACVAVEAAFDVTHDLALSDTRAFVELLRARRLIVDARAER